MSTRIDHFAARQQPWIVAPVVSLAAALAFAAPAHADDAGYLDYVRSHGVPYSNLNPAGVLGEGYEMCAQMHEGMSPQDAANQYGGIDRIWTPAIVYAAQHELCPDTLPAPGGAGDPQPSH